MAAFRDAWLLPILVLSAFQLPLQAQSPASILPQYAPIRSVATVAGIPARSLSGVAFHPGTRTLYAIDNDNAVIYELDTNGILVRALPTSGFTDPEGICFQADDFFLIAEEGLGNVVRIKLPRTGTTAVARSAGTVLNLAPNLANSGIEGVGYRAADHTAYAVKETDPARLYRITLDGNGIPVAAAADQPFDLSAMSGDAADILALEDGGFILVNQERNRLEGLGPAGQPLSSLGLGMAKPEGITLDTVTGTLYAVGEPAEFKAFRRTGTGTGLVPAARKPEHRYRRPWIDLLGRSFGFYRK